MSEFSVRVERIVEPVLDHPDADRLSLIRIGGFTAIANKREDGAPRYAQGDLIVYVPEGAIVPEYLLRQGFWDEAKGRGILAGKGYDRVRAVRLRGVVSQGILFPVEREPEGLDILRADQDRWREVREGDDVAEYLGITKYEPPVPIGMAGEVASVPAAAVGYDFESIQRLPDLFEDGEAVEATEKLHGTNFQFGYVPNLCHPELFYDGSLYCCSKGLGAKGLVFKDNAANDGNLYVRALRALVADGLGDRLKVLSAICNDPIRIFAEIVGEGVQDLGYGLKSPAVRVFDIRVGDDFIVPEHVRETADALRLDRVPILYEGPYDLAALTEQRDGRDTLSGGHVREGIVVRSATGARHATHGRKIGKLVSPDYLLRKNATEYT